MKRESCGKVNARVRAGRDQNSRRRVEFVVRLCSFDCVDAARREAVEMVEACGVRLSRHRLRAGDRDRCARERRAVLVADESRQREGRLRRSA